MTYVSRRLNTKGRCPYCDRKMERGHPRLAPSRDHVIPKSKGGRATIVCCVECNNHKGDLLPHEWIAYMAANPSWWVMSGLQRQKAAILARYAPPIADAVAQIRTRQPSRQRQGSPKMAVVVPADLIFPTVMPIEHSKYILTHGKKAYRCWVAAGCPDKDTPVVHPSLPGGEPGGVLDRASEVGEQVPLPGVDGGTAG